MILRDLTEDDLPVLFEHQRDPEANRMADFPARTWDAFMAHWRQMVLPDERVGKQAIVVGDQLVGNVGSWDQDGRRLVGYWLGRPFWGRGLGHGGAGGVLGVGATPARLRGPAQHRIDPRPGEVRVRAGE